jgi:hypothetical protein
MEDFKQAPHTIEINVYAELAADDRFQLCVLESAFVPRVGDGFDYTDHHFHGPYNRLSIELRVIWVRWDYQQDIQQFFAVHIGVEPVSSEGRALLLAVRAKDHQQRDEDPVF